MCLAGLNSFIYNSSQYATAKDCSFDNSAVTPGVPHGSVLGPLLFFFIYVNDLPNCVKFSTIKLFADDYVLYSKITNSTDSIKLVNDLDNLFRVMTGK